MSRRPSRAMTLALLAATALALHLLAWYASGRFGPLLPGQIGMALGAAWLLLTLLAGTTLATEVMLRRIPLRSAFRVFPLLVVLAVPIAHALLPGPEVGDLAFQFGFRQRLESQVPSKELHAAVAALIANRRAEGKQSVTYSTKAQLVSLPKSVRLLRPARVAVEVPSQTVRISWNRRFTSWQMVVTPETIRFEGID